jgi:hypothetical protein
MVSNATRRPPREAGRPEVEVELIIKNSGSFMAGDQRSTTEFTEIHGKENPNQLPLSMSFGVFSGYPFVMIFPAWVIVVPLIKI